MLTPDRIAADTPFSLTTACYDSAVVPAAKGATYDRPFPVCAALSQKIGKMAGPCDGALSARPCDGFDGQVEVFRA